MTLAATPTGSRSPSRRAVGWWLIVMAVLVAAMVMIGGLTRLTGSGLSITEWKPVTGIIPPLTQDAWQTAFRDYQQIPQYRFENRGMTLAQFHAIYWWEWTHRLLGRLLAVVFLLPFIAFAATGAIARKDWPHMLLLFMLGGLQGAVGWWMVESGLEVRISVSQYRLAIHLGVALILFAALLWTAFEYLHDSFPAPRDLSAGAQSANAEGRGKGTAKRGRGQIVVASSLTMVALVYVQMLLGALVAGLHAGLIYNTWPSMAGRALPEAPFARQPWWSNFFENAGLAQFDHRVVAYVVAAAVLTFWILMRRSPDRRGVRTSSSALLAIVVIQVMLGIITLLNQAPLALAALHQATAVALFAGALWNAFRSRETLLQNRIIVPAKAGIRI